MQINLIQSIQNKEKIPNCTSSMGLTRESMTQGDNTSQRANDTINSGFHLLKSDHLTFIAQLLDGKNLKNFRLVCLNTCKSYLNNTSLLVKIALHELKLESMSKWNFIKEHKLNCILSINASTLQLFYDFITNKSINKSELIKKTTKIESLKTSSLATNDIVILKNLLKAINENPHLFPNLKILKTTQFCDFTNCQIPSSIEDFESIDDNQIPDSTKYQEHINVNICNLNNLKSITLGIMLESNILKLQNLPNLESLKIKCLYRAPNVSNLEIQLKNHPKLSSVIINGSEKMCPKSITRIVQGSEPTNTQWITTVEMPTDAISFGGITRHYLYMQVGLY